jgi:hypothetical protein
MVSQSTFTNYLTEMNRTPRPPSSSSSSYHTPPEPIFSPDIKQVVFPHQHYRRLCHGFEQIQMCAPRAEYPIGYNQPFSAYSSPFTDEVPPLLVNKVFPTYVRHTICFQCQRTSHYKYFCPYYHCDNYSPPYYSEDDDEEEDEDDVPNQLLDDQEYVNDLSRNGSWQNVLGEPVGL